jgi:hypothetical protein
MRSMLSNPLEGRKATFSGIVPLLSLFTYIIVLIFTFNLSRESLRLILYLFIKVPSTAGISVPILHLPEPTYKLLNQHRTQQAQI